MIANDAENFPVFTSDSPMAVARALLEGPIFSVGEGQRGIFYSGTDFWIWRGDRWRMFTVEQMEREILRLTEKAKVSHRKLEKHEDGSSSWREFVVDLDPTPFLVQNVVKCLMAISEEEVKEIPFFLGRGRSDVDPNEILTFEDRLVWWGEGGKWESMERPAEWVSKYVLPCRWEDVRDLEGAPPVWDRCLEDWSLGDEKWKMALQEWMGYCLVPSIRFEKFMLLYKATRGGKGTIVRVMEAMLGDAMQSIDMQTLAGDFGASAVRGSTLITVPEVEKGSNLVSSRLSRFLKTVLGRDQVTVNVKFQTPVRSRIQAKMQLLGNEMPGLENVGNSITSKMLVLPFKVSFEGRQDFKLDEKLKAELGHIVRWAMEGWRRLLEGEGSPATMWSRPEGYEGVLNDFKRRSNPYSAFLKTCFTENPTGWVEMDTVKKMFVEFCSENRMPVPCPVMMMGSKLIEEGGWAIMKQKSRGEGKRYVWGLQGLSLRKQKLYEDE